MGLVAPLMTVVLLGVDDPLATKASPKLFKTIDLTVESKPVGEFLKSFAAEQGVEIVVDGRVDATATVRGRFKKSFVERIFSDAARFANARMVVVGEVVYIAPQESADRVAAAFLKARRRLRRTRTSTRPPGRKTLEKWDGEATVQSLVVGLAKELGLTVKNADDLDVKASRRVAEERHGLQPASPCGRRSPTRRGRSTRRARRSRSPPFPKTPDSNDAFGRRRRRKRPAAPMDTVHCPTRRCRST